MVVGYERMIDRKIVSVLGLSDGASSSSASATNRSTVTCVPPARSLCATRTYSINLGEMKFIVIGIRRGIVRIRWSVNFAAKERSVRRSVRGAHVVFALLGLFRRLIAARTATTDDTTHR